jgi:sigma-B regulation protein RsbU (phosphoserine phosphatase)
MLDMDGQEPPTQIDLILMDVLMPELDGVEACRQIKSRPHLCDIPIIMVTAKSDLSISKQPLRRERMITSPNL